MAEISTKELLEQNKGMSAPVERGESFQTIYINGSRIGLSPFDIRVTFGLLLEVTPSNAVNSELVTVVMSPQHAKSLARILNENIKNWE